LSTEEVLRIGTVSFQQIIINVIPLQIILSSIFALNSRFDFTRSCFDSPAIASFFFRQSKQRYGPPHGACGEAQQPPPLSVIKPSNAPYSTWREGSEAVFKDGFLPNLQERGFVINEASPSQ
jgi:hypothetical protein